MGYYFYYPPENKIFVARNAEFFENSLIVQEASGSHGLLKMSRSDEGLELIQEEDTQPSKNTSKEHNEVMPIEYELGDLNEPSNYKDALSDPEYDKWLEAMNTKTQSMKDNQVWILVELSPNGRTVRSKWPLFAFQGRRNAWMAMYTPLKLQASRSWNKKFDVEIKKIGFTQNPDEPCVYLKASGSNVAFLILYVDEILIMENNITCCKKVKSWLCKCFSMKDLGKAAYILGIKIIHDRSKRLIALSQCGYLEKILKKFRMENTKKGYTPIMEKPDYRKSKGAKTPSEVQRMQRVPYASAIGSIIYAVRCTRPDVAFAQNLCSRFQQNPAELKVSCYADASFQLDKDNTKSQTGYVFVLNGGAIDWKSAKQSTTAMSSTKVEYIATAEASMEAMLYDNEPAIAIAADPGILKGARHFQRKYHYIREVIQEREIVFKKVHIDDNIADPFIKPMSFNKHYKHAMAIGIVPASSLM
ncbi:retrotransposon protein, putative, ty1-copia subclass [Tanacetum coccineum]